MVRSWLPSCTPEDGSEVAEPHYTEGVLATVGDRYTLSEHLWDYLNAYAAKHRARGNGFGYGLVGGADTTRTLSARYYKDGSEILVAQESNLPRRLTPRECSRLMGFERADRIPVHDPRFRYPSLPAVWKCRCGASREGSSRIYAGLAGLTCRHGHGRRCNP